MLICDCIRIQTNSKNLHFWGGGGKGEHWLLVASGRDSDLNFISPQGYL